MNEDFQGQGGKGIFSMHSENGGKENAVPMHSKLCNRFLLLRKNKISLFFILKVAIFLILLLPHKISIFIKKVYIVRQNGR